MRCQASKTITLRLERSTIAIYKPFVLYYYCTLHLQFPSSIPITIAYIHAHVYCCVRTHKAQGFVALGWKLINDFPFLLLRINILLVLSYYVCFYSSILSQWYTWKTWSEKVIAHISDTEKYKKLLFKSIIQHL